MIGDWLLVIVSMPVAAFSCLTIRARRATERAAPLISKYARKPLRSPVVSGQKSSLFSPKKRMFLLPPSSSVGE